MKYKIDFLKISTKKMLSLLIYCYILTFLGAVTYQEYNPNDERFRILALEKAKIRLEQSERNWTNAKELFENKLISRDEFLQYELQYKNDKLNYDQYLLSVIFDKPYITVLKADKVKDENGEIFVEITLKNSSGGNYGIEENIMEDILESKISVSEMFNLYVSIKDLQRNIISQPYEYHIKKMSFNQEYTIMFKILRDVESVIISTNYGDKIDEKQVFLSRKQDTNLIMINPEYYAQEVENGQMVTFKLMMEYFGDTRQGFKLVTEELPDIFTWDVISLQSQVTLSGLSFSPSETIQTYGLRIRVPEKIGDNLEFDKPILFKVLLMNQIGEISGQTELQIVPTGRVNMKLSVNNLYWKGDDSEEITFKALRLENDGMKTITNISADVLLPLDWEYVLIPQKIEKLNPGEKIPIDLKVKMNKKVMPGIYQIKYKMTGNYINRNLQTSEVDFKVEVVKKTNIFVVLFVVIISIVIIITTIWFIIKISKS
ncbi:MAG: NEW3 domain-containing protein [Candidatus Cloacimonetes bacterium]|nr:NEW3 domain-containing protein [Candidatus Cloacimonadota bacterium]MDD4156079.1 NEW3 domain-containing protein [Candidatus Cloacimonadota bacterium]